MDPELKALVEESQRLLKTLREKDAEAADERKRHGEETAETKAAIAEMDTRFEAIDTRIDEIMAKAERPAGEGELSKEDRKAIDVMSRRAGRVLTHDDVKAHDEAFLKFLRHGKQGMTADERKSLVEDTTGEILVSFELDQALYRVLPQLNVIRGLCSRRQTVKDRIRARSITELSVGWGKLETGSTITESSQVPSEAFMYVEDLYGLTKLGEDELMDADFTLESVVSDSFGIAIANEEEAGFVRGTGHTNQEPAGFLAATATGFDGTTVQSNDVTSASTSGAIDLDEFFDVEYNLKPQYAARASWLVHRKSVAGMRKLKDNNGQYLWQQGGYDNGSMAKQPDSFNGYPVYQSPEMDQFPSAAGTKFPVVFADFQSGYLVLDRLGMTIQRLNELYAESGLVGFKVHRRVSGGVIRGEAFSRLKSTHA